MLPPIWRSLTRYQREFAGLGEEDPRFLEALDRFRVVVAPLRNVRISCATIIAIAFEHDRRGRLPRALEILRSGFETDWIAPDGEAATLMIEAARIATRIGPARYASAIEWLDVVASRHARGIEQRYDIALAYYGTRVELATAFGNLDQIATFQRLERATLAECAAAYQASGQSIDPSWNLRERTHAVQAALALDHDDEALAILDALLKDATVRADERLVHDLEGRRRIAEHRLANMQAIPEDVDARLEQLAISRDPDRFRELRQIASIALGLGDFELAKRCIATAGIDPDAAPLGGIPGVNEAILLAYELGFALDTKAEPAWIERWTRGVRIRAAAQIEAMQSAPILAAGMGFLNYPELRHLLSHVIAVELRVEPNAVGKERALEWILRAHVTGTLSRSLHLPVPSLADIRERMLGGNEGALVFMPAGPSGYVFAIDRERIEVSTIAAEKDLKSRRIALRDLVAHEPKHSGVSGDAPVTAEDRDSARAICAAFTAGFLPQAIQERVQTWRSIVVIGGDLIEGLALEPLTLSLGKAPLGETHGIRYLPSFAIGIHVARAVPDPPALRLRLLAATQAPEPALPAIPFDSEDAAEFAALFGHQGSTIELGSAATRTALLATVPATTDVLMILAHGSFDPTQPFPAGIYLAPDAATKTTAQRFGVRDLADFVAPDIVLLAACGTLRGPMRKGDDGPQHLGGAFLRAGARSIVSSKGDLEYFATRRLALEMLKRLAAGDSPGEALRRARIELRRSPHFDHPFYYAAWQLIGRG